MQPIRLEEFTADTAAFDAAVAATEGIDHFCSASDWILPAARALMPARAPWLFRGEAGYAALMRGRHPRGFTYAEPLEAMWGLACPLAGPEVGALVDAFADACRAREDEWDVLVLSGVPRTGPLYRALCDRFTARYQVAIGPAAVRHVADLTGGVDGFLSRRSRNFRRSLRRAEERGRAAGVSFVDALEEPESDADALYQRIQAIEARSWKGRAGVGIESGGMRAFYRLMLRRLVPARRHRLLFARLGGADVGFVLGGMWGEGYRGLQFSFVAEHRELSLGNLCQIAQIRRLCAEGATTYDLGTSGLAYKERWAERVSETAALLIVRGAI